MKKIALLFPGQGAQKVGMGKSFFENFVEARLCLEEAEELLGKKLRELLFFSSHEELSQTKNAQIALFISSIMAWRVLHKECPNIEISAYAGLSLGECTALHLAGSYSFSAALELISYRAQCMERVCRKSPASMAVVLGLDPELIQDLCSHHSLWIANYNCPGQFVLSGTKEALENIKEDLLERGARAVIPLKVEGAFHSPLMKEAGEEFGKFLENKAISMPKTLYLMNETALAPENEENLKKSLSKQIYSPVLWQQSMEYLQKEGIELCLELGCGKILQGLCRRMDMACSSLETTKELEGICALIG